MKRMSFMFKMFFIFQVQLLSLHAGLKHLTAAQFHRESNQDDKHISLQFPTSDVCPCRIKDCLVLSDCCQTAAAGVSARSGQIYVTP